MNGQHRQHIMSQHALHASIAGLAMTALIIFASFTRNGFNLFQKHIFSLAIILILIQVGCLIWVSEHERKRAWEKENKILLDSAILARNEKENCVRWILNYSSFLGWLSISALLIYTIWK